MRSTGMSRVEPRVPSIVSVAAPGMSASSPLPSAFLGMAHDLRGERTITFGSTALRIVEYDRLTEGRGLAQPHVSRNRRLVDPFGEELSRLIGHLLGQIEAGIEHREQHSLDSQALIQVVLDQA